MGCLLVGRSTILSSYYCSIRGIYVALLIALKRAIVATMHTICKRPEIVLLVGKHVCMDGRFVFIIALFTERH